VFWPCSPLQAQPLRAPESDGLPLSISATEEVFTLSSLQLIYLLPLLVCAFMAALAPAGAQGPATPAASGRIPVAMYPPGQDNGRCFRDLFERPGDWAQTRGLISALGYADHVMNRQFTDDQLRAWLPRLQEWGLKLELEVGAVKEWGPTGEETFNAQSPMWDRFRRLGATISAIAMDEPLCCVRTHLKKPDEYAVQETANFIALVRERYPEILIGDIEPAPFLSTPELINWVEALQQRLADMQVRGLDFFRLDVDWVHYVLGNGAWPDIKAFEQYCRGKKINFSLIYWAADYPALQRRGLADDATWYVSIMRQGYDYTQVGGAPDQYVIESWIGAPSHSVPETGDWTFTRSVLDFAKRFARRGK